MINRDQLRGLCWMSCDCCKRAGGPKGKTPAEAIQLAYKAGFRRVEQMYKDLAKPGAPRTKRMRWLCKQCRIESEEATKFYAGLHTEKPEQQSEEK